MTAKQKAALDFIRTFIAATGTSPSYDEIRIALGLGSKSRVHEIVHALIERGYLRAEGAPYSARALVVVGDVHFVEAAE